MTPDWTSLHFWIGSDADTITWWQMSLRAVVLFLWGIVLVRFSGRRAFGRNTAFDILLAVIVGSMISRAITATAPFFPVLAATTTAALLHKGLTHASYHNRFLGRLIKGRKTQLVEGGMLNRDAMRRSGITVGDLREAARKKGHGSLATVEAAYLERSGDISIIGKS